MQIFLSYVRTLDMQVHSNHRLLIQRLQEYCIMQFGVHGRTQAQLSLYMRRQWR